MIVFLTNLNGAAEISEKCSKIGLIMYIRDILWLIYLGYENLHDLH